MSDTETPVAPGADASDIPEQLGITLSGETDRELYAAARQAVANERGVDPEDLSRPDVFRAVARAYVGFDYEESGLVADGGRERDRRHVVDDDQARSISYGPASPESDSWVLRFTTTDGETHAVQLGEDAMYELWTEVQHVPWPREKRPEAALRKTLIDRAMHADAEQLEAMLDAAGGVER